MPPHWITPWHPTNPTETHQRRMYRTETEKEFLMVMVRRKIDELQARHLQLDYYLHFLGKEAGGL